MTATESLWALYSAGQQSEKMVGLYPKRTVPSFLSRPTFLYQGKGAVKGFEVQAGLGKENCNILAPGS